VNKPYYVTKIRGFLQSQNTKCFWASKYENPKLLRNFI